MRQIPLRDLGEVRRLGAAGKQATVDIGKAIGPTGQLGPCPVRTGRVHRTEDFTDDLVGVGAVTIRHPIHCCGEHIATVEDVGVFGKEAKDQPRHEVVHVMAAVGSAPVRVVLDQLDIEPVEAAGCADVKSAFADLFDGANPRQGQEETEVIGRIGIGAGNGVAGGDVLGLKVGAVGGKDELRLGLGGGRAGLEGRKGLSHLPFGAGLEVDVVGLKYAIEVRFVRRTYAQALDGRVLVAEREQERIGELVSVERQLGQRGYGFFDFDGVHLRFPALFYSHVVL